MSLRPFRSMTAELIHTRLAGQQHGAAGIEVGGDALARMGVGGLLHEAAERGEPRETGPSTTARAGTEAPRVGAVVLAGGSSTRMRGPNKLLARIGGRTLVEHAVVAVGQAGLPPPILVVGSARAEIEQALAGRRLQIVHAPDHAQGLSRSLAAGIEAVPDEWDAAIICLGDMPRVDAGVLRRIAGACRDDRDIVVPTYRGKRGNPVLWGRAHFGRLRQLSGDIGGKALLGELAAHVRELPFDSEAVLVDVDTPEALADEQRRAGELPSD
jgi:molybdenum cofactor cytidylyltransferase